MRPFGWFRCKERRKYDPEDRCEGWFWHKGSHYNGNVAWTR